MTRKWRLVLLVSLIGNLTVAYVGYKAYEYRSHINYWLDKYTFVVDEFSRRDVFADANESLKSDTIVPGRVVFFGTQVTVNWPTAESFPGFETINRGIAEQRAAGFLLRFRPDVIELGPEYVVIEVSSYNFRPNTTAREMYDYVISMAELARANGIEPILTSCIPPRAAYEVDEHPEYSVKDTVAMYSEWLKAYASDHEMPIADLAGAVVGEDGYLKEDLSRSMVDLNEAGYGAVTPLIRALLEAREAGGRP